MQAIAARPVNAAEPLMPPRMLRAVTFRRAERLKNLLRAMLQGMGASPRDVPPEFYRFPFP